MSFIQQSSIHYMQTSHIAMKTLTLEMQLFKPKFCLFTERQQNLGYLRDYNTRFPPNLLPLRQTRAFDPRGKNPAVLCSLSLSHSNTLPPHSPALKAADLSLTETVPLFTPYYSYGGFNKGNVLPSLSYLESQVTVLRRNTSHKSVFFLEILNIMTKISN